jgi:hypothetical protein
MIFSTKRNFLLFILLVFYWYGAKSQPAINFDKTTHHLGFVRQGDTLNFQYTFTNTGNQPLIISDAKVECGCTVVDIPLTPILPGKQGFIKVVFHTNSAIDRQDRAIIVLSNASDSPIILRFKCIILKSKKKQQ